MLGFLRFGDLFISLLIRFLLTLIHAVGTLDLNKSSRLRGPDSKRTRSEALTLSLIPMLEKSEVLVLWDQLERHLVGLNVRKSTSRRGLGLARLTRGLVR
jgi:hypothetical protein